MGSWNGTCGVTQLSISSGDPIALFLLVQVDNEESHSQGFCHPTDIWSPIGPPVFGIYNDYGGIDQIEDTPNADQILATLRTFAVAKEPPSKYRPGVDPAAIVDFDYLNDVIHEGNLEVRDICHFASNRERYRLQADPDSPATPEDMQRDISYISNTFRVGQMMVHRKIYDALAAVHPNFLTDERMGPTALDIRDANKILPKLKERIATWAKLRVDSPPEIKEIVASSAMLIRLGIENERSLFSAFFTNYCVYSSQYLKGYADALVSLCMDQQPEFPWTLDMLVKAVCEFMSFHINMLSLRKFFSPQSGAGSQHNNHEDHFRLMGLAGALMDEQKAAYTALWGDDEEPVEDEEGTEDDEKLARE